MAHYFKCPHCEKYVVCEQGELWIEGDSFQCPLCGGIMDLEKDTVDYDYDLFNS